jgi:hypothetical protein
MSKSDKTYFIPEDSPVRPDPFDVRVRLRHLTRGQITPDDVKNYLQNLPDDAEVAETRNYDALVKDESAEGAAPGGSVPGATTH